MTSERTDPLFTIDLSNPAPQQAGELEMPGGSSTWSRAAIASWASATTARPRRAAGRVALRRLEPGDPR
ncbi:MAG: beta-propeller domain-containing protein [Myxococcales bacterium]|nr:beta-propeller domain-containing protein [Myxococcales bacterium]